MDSSRTAPARTAAAETATGTATAQRAKAALRRLAVDKLEPTPENYARAWKLEGGEPASAGTLSADQQRLLGRLAQHALDAEVAEGFVRDLVQGQTAQAERTLDAARSADGAALAMLVEQLLRGAERGGKQWTTARKKDSLQRVLSGSRGDARRLRQRLSQLVASWEGDAQDTSFDADATELASPPAAPAEMLTPIALAPASAPAEQAAALTPSSRAAWSRVVASLLGTLGDALPARNGTGPEVAAALAGWRARLPADGPGAPMADELDAVCAEARRVISHRQHLLEQLGGLCRQLTTSLIELSEDDSWARGQSEAMRVALDDGLTARGVRAVSELLDQTREHQAKLRTERDQARNALKAMIQQMLGELGTLGEQTGRFHESVGRYADTIERADSIESLAGAVREMVEESRTVQALVQQTHERLHSEHAKASDLSQRVQSLEDELKRLSSEVQTDQLTQVANRRGLLAAFEAEQARVARGAGTLAVGLLDIDNFKRLNDELGHAAGDVALKALAEKVSQTLRPTDMVARYGGEEFVVLLPQTPIDEGQQILTRLQRSLSGGLFMHESKTVFVTFSAGVTAYRDGEPIDAALERADQALYEAKRTGKNRTCMA